MKQLNQLINFPKQGKLFREKTGKDFEFFYDKYYDKLVYYVNKICQDDKMAEDLAMESFLIALHKIEKYNREKSQFSTWLFTVAKNHTLQEKKKSKKTVSMDVTVDEDGTTMKDFLESEDSEDVLLDDVWKKKANIMNKHIQNLKEPFRTVIEMREIKKMVYKDIASDLGTDVEFILESIGGNMDLPFELSKVYSVTDKNGETAQFHLIEGDTKKTPFFTQINLQDGEFTIKGRNPKPLSTVKSQIRNGRMKLINDTTKEFTELEEMYL
jgi:RNA polymerase sigma factor (sigma-70 family)